MRTKVVDFVEDWMNCWSRWDSGGQAVQAESREKCKVEGAFTLFRTYLGQEGLKTSDRITHCSPKVSNTFPRTLPCPSKVTGTFKCIGPFHLLTRVYKSTLRRVRWPGGSKLCSAWERAFGRGVGRAGKGSGSGAFEGWLCSF